MGCDLPTRYQQIAMLDEASGELVARWLEQQRDEADASYRRLQGPVHLGIEATGLMHWLQRPALNCFRGLQRGPAFTRGNSQTLPPFVRRGGQRVGHVENL